MEPIRALISKGYTEYYFPIQEEEEEFNELLDGYFYKGKPVAELWRSKIMLRGILKKSTDFFEILDTGLLAVGGNVYENFKENSQNIEFLPLETDTGIFYIANVIEFTDCLDKENSVYKLSKTGRISSYEVLELNEDLLGELMFFKIPELPHRLFCTESLYRLCISKGYRGLDFSL